MRQRKRFQPTVLEGLEARVVLSHGNSFFDPFGLEHALSSAILGKGQPSSSAVTVGALGDSYTDEYKFYPPDRSQARNWVEVLSATRGLNFGAFTTRSRGEPRDSGFAFNWARSDATSTDMVQLQLPGLTAQVAKGQVKYVRIFIGGNDFGQLAENVAVGKVAADQVVPALLQTEAQLEANFTTAVNTLLAANAKVKLVVTTLPAITTQPIYRTALATPLGQTVAAALGAATQKYNALIASTAAGNSRVALDDLAAASAKLNQVGGTTGQVPFGGTTINLLPTGDDYHDFFLADGIHVGTVAQGVIADSFINAIDGKFAARVAPLTERQIVQFASHVRPRTP